MDPWTYLVIVHAVATFANVDLERTWMRVEGPFDSEAACYQHREIQSIKTDYSQCMPLYQAEGLARPYNQGAFVLVHEKERT